MSCVRAWISQISEDSGASSVDFCWPCTVHLRHSSMTRKPFRLHALVPSGRMRWSLCNKSFLQAHLVKAGKWMQKEVLTRNMPARSCRQHNNRKAGHQTPSQNDAAGVYVVMQPNAELHLLQIWIC